MNNPQPRPLRIAPGVVLVVLQWTLRFGMPLVLPDTMPISVMSALALGLLVLIWWVFFSRAPLGERWAVLGLIVLSVIGFRPLLHPSIAEGMMGMMYVIEVVPVLCLGLVGWCVLSRTRGTGFRRGGLVAVVLLSTGLWTLLRSNGIDGSAAVDLHWRWSDTAEARLVAETVPAGDAAARALTEAEPVWPGFRGPTHDSRVTAPRLAVNWETEAPRAVWRRPIGPGWSSFAVSGDVFFTQEQRGEEEVVACYRLATGEPVWRHGDPIRFWEANAGAGPRATPTLADGRVYALGATGRLNVLQMVDGAVVWSRDAAADAGTETPIWGYSGSPLVQDGFVYVPLAGKLLRYDLEGQNPKLLNDADGDGYVSPQPMVIDGVPQILMVDRGGVTAVAASDGAALWRHEWEGYPIVQPAATADGDVLVCVNESDGIRRLSPRRSTEGWTVTERWTTKGLKPYFNDFVQHQGHAFGFDGRILSCIDLETGERTWKGGRYGQGQMLLLPDQDLLLVLSERGEVALVRADVAAFTELGRFQAIDGKTWNHPVLVHDLLLVRNDREAAAYRLPLAAD